MEAWNGAHAPRDGSGPLVETYPAAALCSWDLVYRKYKGDSEENVRKTILDGLRPRADLREVEQEAVRSDHVLDALISGLVVVEAERERTTTPETEEEIAAARVEGWIHVPV
jgi:hypothetical protein